MTDQQLCSACYKPVDPCGNCMGCAKPAYRCDCE